MRISAKKLRVGALLARDALYIGRGSRVIRRQQIEGAEPLSTPNPSTRRRVTIHEPGQDANGVPYASHLLEACVQKIKAFPRTILRAHIVPRSKYVTASGVEPEV